MDHKGLWQAVLGELEVTLTGANFSTWFKQTSVLSNEDGYVVVGVPNSFIKEWIEKKFHEDVKRTITKIQPDIHTIEYRISGQMAAPATKPATSTKREASKVSRQTSLPIPAAQPSHSINPRYTFESFVVGSSNELAYAACQAVAKNPGSKYNPLYLYGGVGLGKTHLMQAVGNEILRRDPSKRIEYVTSETFTNEFVESLMKKKVSSFVDKYRGVDVLIVDDMQFLVGKERTQEEFFHTFNALHQANKQIIISSDKPPQLLTNLEDRLRSRFAWGMTADIQIPDLETRSAILQAKATAQGKVLPLDVVDYLARHAQSNIRELEGVLTQLLGACEVRGVEPNVGLATQLLAGQAAARPKTKPLTTKLVIERVAHYYDLQAGDIMGPKRDKEIVVPRQLSMYIMRHEMSLSFPKIAAAVGGRDHTTAMHSVTKIEKQLENDERLRSDLGSIKSQLATVSS